MTLFDGSSIAESLLPLEGFPPIDFNKIKKSKKNIFFFYI